VDNPAITTVPGAIAYVLADLKAFLRVAHTDDDTQLGQMAETATQYIQNYTGRQLVNATYTWKLPSFHPCRENKGLDFWFSSTPYGLRGSKIIQFPVLPLVSITSIAYRDAAGNAQTLTAQDYEVDTVNGRIMPSATLGLWPETSTDIFNPVTIVFVAGYGSGASNVPARIKQALYNIVAYWYENRDANNGISYNEAPDTFTDLLSEFKKRVF
jgi:uncharacterized phiE125 gp8 family phage protein